MAEYTIRTGTNTAGTWHAEVFRTDVDPRREANGFGITEFAAAGSGIAKIRAEEEAEAEQS